jgi:hypothetical protein
VGASTRRWQAGHTTTKGSEMKSLPYLLIVALAAWIVSLGDRRAA